MEEAAAAPEEASPSDASSSAPKIACVLSEVSGCFLWVVITLFVVAAFGLYKVHPPGEEDLCALQTLGLVNATEAKQVIVMTACHSLYKTVFLFSRSFAGAFVVLCLLPLSLLGLARGGRRKEGAASACRYVWSAVLDAVAVAVLWFPSGVLFDISATVTVVMAPITAQWLAIYTAYFGMKATKHEPPHWLTIIYQSYVACWYADTFLWVGTVAVLLLWGFCIGDLVRNILAAFGLRPRYSSSNGSEVCRLRRLWCSRARASCSSWCSRLRSGCDACQESGCSGCCAWLRRRIGADPEPGAGPEPGAEYQKI